MARADPRRRFRVAARAPDLHQDADAGEQDDLKRRIEEASRFIAVNRLALSPQCGFASSEQGNPVTPEAQQAKLALTVELAQEVWGSA